MRTARRAIAWAALAVPMLPAAAGAVVSITSAATENIACSGGVCTPSAADATLNVTDLENDLAESSVTINTNGALAKDIHVGAALGWASGSILTLDAYRSVAIYAGVSDRGSGGLSLLTNDGGTDGTLSFGVHGNATFADLSDRLTINGTAYTLVGDIATLAADVESNSEGSFALANSYNAKADGTYSQSPVPTFGGTFEGLGNSITNLNIFASDQPASFFAGIADGATVRDFALKAAIIHVGGGHVSWLGVLAGGIDDTSNVVACYVGGRIYSDSHNSAIGGLVGVNYGTISKTVAKVTVQVVHGHSSWVGGLVGANYGAILNSFAEGPVSAADEAEAAPTEVGGLLGSNGDGPVGSGTQAARSRIHTPRAR